MRTTFKQSWKIFKYHSFIEQNGKLYKVKDQIYENTYIHLIEKSINNFSISYILWKIKEYAYNETNSSFIINKKLKFELKNIKNILLS